jgi:ribose transport system ATP-binding protein
LGIEVLAGDIYLTTEPLRGGGLINDREARRRAAEVFKVMEVDINPGAVLGNLSTAFWQLTEIAKALAQDAQVLIMDEPTASLAKHETEHLFQLVERLKARGISIVYISHRMDEVYRIADRITILRDGQRLFTKPLILAEGLSRCGIGGQAATDRHRASQRPAFQRGTGGVRRVPGADDLPARNRPGRDAGEAMPISSPARRSGRGAACPTASSGWCPDPTPRRCAVACRPRRPPHGPPDV